MKQDFMFLMLLSRRTVLIGSYPVLYVTTGHHLSLNCPVLFVISVIKGNCSLFLTSGMFDISGPSDARYIRVETCMFMVKLPEYSTQEKMTEKLLYAINCREDPLTDM